MDEKLSDSDLQHVRGLLSTATGLNFPPSREDELRRGIASTAKELGHASSASFSRRLTTGPSGERELQSLINNLTIGETYFFRDLRCFEVLTGDILPQLISHRRNTDRRLRIWSAACCTGEEAYSIAIVLRQMIPDWQDWNITLLATDINSRFLRKAISGVFGKWSFRDAPSWLKTSYFEPVGEGKYEILPDLKRMVRFEQLNLASAAYPSSQTDTNEMDIIFCRNVLMYFTQEQARGVLQRLYQAQAEEGWLLVGPSELPDVSCQPYAGANHKGTLVFQKRNTSCAPELEQVEPAEFVPFAATALDPEVVDKRDSLSPAPVENLNSSELPTHVALNEQAALLAGEGKLAEALDCCNQSIAADRFNASSHYLQAVILQEQGQIDRAIRSLQTALYLDPDYVPAHFVLGSIARKRSDVTEAARHLRNTRKLLCRYRAHDLLPEFEGVTAGRLIEVVDALMQEEVAA